jgi:hypothetical protein
MIISIIFLLFSPLYVLTESEVISEEKFCQINNYNINHKFSDNFNDHELNHMLYILFFGDKQQIDDIRQRYFNPLDNKIDIKTSCSSCRCFNQPGNCYCFNSYCYDCSGWTCRGNCGC